MFPPLWFAKTPAGGKLAAVTLLRRRFWRGTTVWVVYGDHGEAFVQHEGNYGHTFFLYDENIHVPFLIAAPGLIRRQERVSKVVSLVDTAPTVLDLLGISPPANYQGRTMLDGVPRTALFFADYSLGFLGLRDGPWKFVYEIESGKEQLFKMDQDPGELSNLAPSESARASWYGRVVRGWSAEQKRLIERSAKITPHLAQWRSER
jgi:arylsulfatase A-like enzyme